MRMTLEECKKRFPNHPPPTPAAYAGQWVAWDDRRGGIVAHGDDLTAVCDAARTAGHDHPIMQRVLGAAFVGGA